MQIKRVIWKKNTITKEKGATLHSKQSLESNIRKKVFLFQELGY